MQKMSRIMVVAASAAALVFRPARVALAQGAPSAGTAPTATSTAAPETTAPEKEKAAPKKKKPAAGD